MASRPCQTHEVIEDLSDESGNDEVIFHGRSITKSLAMNAKHALSPIVNDITEPSIARAAVNKRRPTQEKNRSKRRNRFPDEDSDFAQDAALADYLSNLAAAEEDDPASAHSRFPSRDLGGPYEAQYESESFADSDEDAVGKDAIGRDEEIAKAINLSCLSGADEARHTREPYVLEHRIRKKKVQYFISLGDSNTSKSQWMSRKVIMKSSSLRLAVSIYEAIRTRDRVAFSPDISEGSTPDDVDLEGDLQADIDEIEQDEAIIKHHISHMDDEQFARLAAKQEELGLDCEDLVLFDDIVFDDARMARRSGHSSKGSKGSKLRSFDKSKSAEGKATPASAHYVEDMFTGTEDTFLSRKRTKKDRRADMNFDHVDPILRDNLQKAWENDRSKKRAKKRDREELRSQGLLGTRNADDVDLKKKYAGGMKLEDIKAEIRAFLEGPRQSMSLPGMDSQARKTVHGICHKLGLKSKSMGSGNARFPILYKTSRTKSFNKDAFEQVRRGFFGAPGNSRKSLGLIERAQISRNISHGQYRDGEIVGASAPELGEENRGRAMLEKMGWSKGTNLGATNNPGIAEPVAQIVKRSRAGLG